MQAPHDSPQAAYQRALAAGFVVDAAQRRAVEALQHCHEAVERGERPLGVYLWGPVGRGKTWLMDSFYNALRVPARRQHFHHFMQWVHRRQFQLTGNADPLRLLAEELGREVRVLCFDELFVSDIGDAMLLGRLLSLVVEQGVVLVATSNQPPDQLYAEGYNRERFLPAIAALTAHMQVVAVDGEQDHRLHPGAEVQRYWVKQPQALGELFARLSEGRSSAVSQCSWPIAAYRPSAIVRPRYGVASVICASSHWQRWISSNCASAFRPSCLAKCRAWVASNARAHRPWHRGRCRAGRCRGSAIAGAVA